MTTQEALNQVPTQMSVATDLISRADAINKIKDIPYVQEHPKIGLLFEEWVKELPSAKPDLNWIPCSERLPENSDKVLTTKKYPFGIYVEMDKYFNGRWLGDIPDEDCKTACETIAWLPLPDPYKGVTE